MEIGIVNWDKYNPKRDQKTYTWLRLDNEVCTGQDMSEYDAHELLVWIALLCEASKKNSGSLSLKLKYIATAARTTTDIVSNALNKLMVDGLIQIHDFVHTATHDRGTTEPDRARPQDSGTTTPTNVRTDETNERDETNTVDSSIPKDLLNTIKTTMLYPDEIIEEVRKDAWLKFQASDKSDKNWKRWVGNYFHNEKEKIRNLMVDKGKVVKKTDAVSGEIEMSSKIYTQVTRAGRDGVKEIIKGFNPIETKALEIFGLASEIYNCPSEFAANDIKKRLKSACEQAIEQSRSGVAC